MQGHKPIVPEDTGDNRVQPDLSLSPKEIMERWTRNLPLDVVTRNGSFYVENDVDGTRDNLSDDAFDVEDFERMDLVDAEEYLATRNLPYRSHESHAPRSEANDPGDGGKNTTPPEPGSEPSDNGAG